MRYDLIRLLWLEDKSIAGPVEVAPSAAMEGELIAEIVMPNPTNWAVLDEGDIELDGGGGGARSDTQHLRRSTELSKLLVKISVRFRKESDCGLT